MLWTHPILPQTEELPALLRKYLLWFDVFFFINTYERHTNKVILSVLILSWYKKSFLNFKRWFCLTEMSIEQYRRKPLRSNCQYSLVSSLLVDFTDKRKVYGYPVLLLTSFTALNCSEADSFFYWSLVTTERSEGVLFECIW